MINILDEMDEIFGLVIALDRQVVQGNWKQAYTLAKRLGVKISSLVGDLYLQLIDENEFKRDDL